MSINNQLVMKPLSEQLTWKTHADSLATWTLDHLVNRTDAYVKYYKDPEGKSRSCTVKEPVEYNLVYEHYSADRIIGLHTTSKDDLCRWFTIDVDRHDGDPEEFVEKNDGYSRHLYEWLRGWGFRPLLLDSNGKGGRHLTVLLDEPAPARKVRAFGLWLVRGWQEFGLTQQPEVFPKQDSIIKEDGQVGFGNIVRLPGKHHKRPHYTRVWDGDSWRSGEDAIEFILDRTGDSLSLAPPESLTFQPFDEKKTERPAWWKRYAGDLKTLDIAKLFESRGLRVESKGNDQYEVACPWSYQHTTGMDVAYLKPADEERSLFPAFHCPHQHCDGRDIEDVLAFFGKPAVDRHCQRKFAASRREEKQEECHTHVIDPSDPLGTARSYHQGSGISLVHHAGVWRNWDGKKYALVAELDVRADVWKWLAKCSLKAGTSTPYIPTPTAVNAVMDALKSVTNQKATTAIPSWIGEGGGPVPENIIPFQNGLLDLGQYTATGEFNLLPHSPRWFSDTCLPHAFDPQAKCPLWQKFLDEVFEGDSERIRSLAQWFGYNLTDDTRQHKFVLLIGPSRSGKSTTAKVLSHMLGNHNVANPSLTALGSRFGMAPLVGKLAAIVGDGHLGRSSDATAILEKLKSITGGDPQNIDRKNVAELANVQIKARFTIAVNELPRFPDASAALVSRMLVLPLGVSFAGREDHDLGERLLGEIAGITNWALAGLMDLRQSGRLLQPKAGRVFLEDFARLSSPVRAFLQDCCELGANFSVKCVGMRAAWTKWCEANGHEPGGESNFGAKLRAVNPKIERTRRREDGRQIHYYKGVRLVE